MVLLQITEPNEPNSSYLSVGIDLGTTNSLIASVKDSEVALVTNYDGSCLFPSKVKYYGDSTHSVGNEKDTKKGNKQKAKEVNKKPSSNKNNKEIRKTVVKRTIETQETQETQDTRNKNYIGAPVEGSKEIKAKKTGWWNK